MDNKINLFLCLALLQVLVLNLPPCREVVYDHYVLALTWPTQYCSENSCQRNWESSWDKKSLVIHGLWPSSVDLAFVTCLIEHEYDPYCFQPYNFDEFQFSSKQIQQMRKYWPKLNNVGNFWSHQWRKHGTCYLEIIKDQYKSNLKLSQIYKSYFIQTVRKTKNLSISLTKGKIASKLDLSKIIKIPIDNFYAYCGGDNELDQIRVCYTITAEPGKQVIKKCPASRDNKLCSFPIQVK